WRCGRPDRHQPAHAPGRRQKRAKSEGRTSPDACFLGGCRTKEWPCRKATNARRPSQDRGRVRLPRGNRPLCWTDLIPAKIELLSISYNFAPAAGFARQPPRVAGLSLDRGLSAPRTESESQRKEAWACSDRISKPPFGSTEPRGSPRCRTNEGGVRATGRAGQRPR